MKNKAIKQELLFLIILGLIWRPLFFNDTYAGETKNITLLYTGSTHAMIYPCRCPIEPDGGVARRATLFKRLKKSYPSALILDTGNFVAGGPEDEYAQAPVLDAYRTLTNIRAMEIMGYDAAAVGDDEFNLGLDFFRQNIANAKFNLLSANLQEKNISPYMIAEVSGVKIGVIGLTNIVAAKKIAELKINNPKDSLVSAIDETRRKGAAIIVVLSNMGESEDVKLLSEVSGIDILIVGNAHLSANPFSQMGKTIVLRTGWKGRQVGKITFQWQDNRISHFKVEELRVYPQLKDDAEVLKILPRCFDNSYCKKEGFAGICENPGTMQSQCVFRE
ncbi:MAG: hypothetical protein NC923_05000, partial [Candidatus Omnitrophica bacterium]|nr:hypothetical protein [Candidatus Omnitrophota bacterium]